MTQSDLIRFFATIDVQDIALVGGKNASLGELYRHLASEGVRVPNGFAVTTEAYRRHLAAAGGVSAVRALFDGLDPRDVGDLARRSAAARRLLTDTPLASELRAAILDGYKALRNEYGEGVSLAVRSSATAEDLPTASFAGQHDSYLAVRGEQALLDACRRCFASLFNDRAVHYRLKQGLGLADVALSVGVMKMVRSDLAASGVMFSLDTESGFRDVVFITGSYGLGENVVQGAVDPDEFYVHKPSFRAGHRAVLRRTLGSKQLTMGLAPGHFGATTRNLPTEATKRLRFCLKDEEVLELAAAALAIEAHYSAQAGHPQPMDIEWAKDGENGALFIVQARPETVAARKKAGMLDTYTLQTRGTAVVTGRAVGEKIATGVVRVVTSAKDLEIFRPGEVLVAAATNPDWEPVMKTAGAIVTDHGGRTCHAAIVARELGVPAVVGAGVATATLHTGDSVTVSCAGGEVGTVYAGALAFEVSHVDAATLALPKTPIMVNLGNPDLAFTTAMMPSAGVGLARMEFIINEHIGVHPMALVHPEKITEAERQRIRELSRNDPSPRAFFIRELAEGVGTIAAAFFPRPVIVRLSDFKSNEYAALLGGSAFEPKEANPMLGFRGAARYAHPAYAEGFALECAALLRVRREMGLTNLLVMVPFCRRVDEAKTVLAEMARHGLRRGEDGLEIYVMCEIPNNVIQIDAFSEVFDGFSIGSNDLTQLTLGVDRDSDIVAFDFDERDPGMLEMLRLAVTGAQRNHRKVGICGEAPANYPEIAAFLARLGIGSISVNPASLLRTLAIVRAAEETASPT